MRTTDAAGPSPREIIRNWLLNNASPFVDYAELVQGEFVVQDHEAERDAGAVVAALESAGWQIIRQRAGVVERATIERGVMDGYDAAGSRWDAKLREHDGQLDGHDAYAVIVTAITDAVMAEIEKDRATGDGET
jgi:hypothetical protein